MTAGSGCSTSRWCLVLRDDIRALAARLPGPWDLIVGIPRGGLVVAAMLGYQLDVKRVGAYGRDYTRPVEGEAPDVGGCYATVKVAKGDRVLVVEDATVTGTLLSSAWAHFANQGARCTTAALYVTRDAWLPDVWLHEVDEVPSGRVLLGLAQAVSRG